jgi:hypothetical protein
MLSRLRPFDESEINGNMVRGLLKTIQGEAQVRSSHKGGKNSSGTTTNNKEKASASSSGPSDKGGVGAKTRSTSEAAAFSTGGYEEEEPKAATASWEILRGGDDATSAVVDRWEILARRLLKN